MPHRKNCQELLSSTENKSQLLKRFTYYLTQENALKDLMRRATLNIEKDTVLISLMPITKCFLHQIKKKQTLLLRK